MARDKGTLSSVDNSNPTDYPNGRIKDNTGVGNGTPVNEFVYGDIHETLAKAMRLYNINYNGLPDNENNGYQLLDSLIALASKNDFCLDLTSVGGELRVPLKIGSLKDNEVFIVKAAVDKTTETAIRGSLDNNLKAVTFLGDFKAGEYVRLINTSTSVVAVRLVDHFNLDTTVADLLYLKKASQAEENAGTVDNKATTPLTNKTVFDRRVNGVDSANHLAVSAADPGSQNGLLSATDKEKIDNLADPTGLIEITGDTYVAVNSPSGGALQTNFNFNYVDVVPPAGKTMANLKGFMASSSFTHFSGDVNGDDRMWCRWQIEATKIRIICGNSEINATPRVNWMAIWI